MADVNMKLMKRGDSKILIFVFLGLIVFLILFSSPMRAFAGEPIYKVLSNTSSGEGAVTKNVWGRLMDFVNSFVIIILIAVAFAQILRINVNTYGVKKILPTLVLAIIAANFSFLFCRLMVDIANIILSVFFEGTRNLNSVNSTDGIDGFRDAFHISFGGTPSDITGGKIFWFYIAQLLKIAGAIVVYILAYLFFVRNWVIYFLIALAPISIMSMVLPQSKTLFNQWWSNLLKWIFMPIVSLFWIWVGSQWFKFSFAGDIYFLNFLFAGLCFYLAITTPFKMGGAIMGQWGNIGKRIWGATGGRAVSFAGREAKERGIDAGLRATAYLQRGNRIGRSLDESIGRRIRGLKQRNVEARQERLLRAEGPSLVRKKMEDDAKADAAFRLANDPRTQNDARSRYRAIVRSWVPDNIKRFENQGLQTLLDDLAVNPDGTVATSEHNDVIPANVNFTDEEGMGNQLARLEAIRRIIRRPNSLSENERRIAQAIISRQSVTYGASRGTATTGPLEARNGRGNRVDIRNIDTNGFGSSAVGEEVAEVEEDLLESAASALHRTLPGQAGAMVGRLLSGHGIDDLVQQVGDNPQAQAGLRDSLSQMQNHFNDLASAFEKQGEEEIERKITGVRMLMAGGGSSTRSALKVDLDKAEEMLGRKAIGELKNLSPMIHNIGMGGIDQKSPEYESAVRKRISNLRAGMEHFENIDKELAGLSGSDKTLRISQYNQAMRNPAYIQGVQNDLKQQNAINARAMAAGHVAASTVLSNPQLQNVSISSLRQNEAIATELKNAAQEMSSAASEMKEGVGSINMRGTGINDVADKTAYQNMVTGAINGALAKAPTSISPQSTLGDPNVRRLFAQQLATAMAPQMAKSFAGALNKTTIKVNAPSTPPTTTPPAQQPPAQGPQNQPTTTPPPSATK